jgi:WD40 repeat protein
VRGYDIRSGKARAEVELETGAINRIAASPDRSRVAVVGCRRFHLLAADQLRAIASDTQRALSSGASALAFSPCGRTVVYTAGRTLFVWDAVRVRAVNQIQLEAKPFTDAAFTPDGRRLITTSRDGATRVWDTATWTPERTLAWGVGPLRAVAVAPDGARAAVAGDTGRVVVWDLDT